MELQRGHQRRVTERLKHYVNHAQAIDLLDKLLALDPSKRLDSTTALDHDFFWQDPMPSDLSKMLSSLTQVIIFTMLVIYLSFTYQVKSKCNKG